MSSVASAEPSCRNGTIRSTTASGNGIMNTRKESGKSAALKARPPKNSSKPPTKIVQAEKMGMSYADVLHSQALQMRIMRQYRAKEIANKLPAKMIIPMALLTFPSIMIILMAPAAFQIAGAFGPLLGGL